MSRILKLIVRGLTIIAAACFVGYLSLYFLINAAFEYAFYSNPNSVAFGDGGSVWIPIDRDTVLPVGSSTNLNDLLLTVENVAPITDTTGMDVLAEGWTYWKVNIRLQNNSITDTIRVDPSYSRIQALPPDKGPPYPAPYIDTGFATMEYRMKHQTELAPGEVLKGSLIYKVKQDSSEVFWIYEGYSEDAIFKVR